MKKFLLLSLLTFFVIIQLALGQTDTVWTKKTGGTAKKIDAMDVSHNSQYILIAGSHTFSDTSAYHSMFNLADGSEVITFDNSYKYDKTFFSITDDTIFSKVKGEDLLLMHSTENGEEIGRIEFDSSFEPNISGVELSPKGNQLLFLYKYNHYGYPLDWDAHDTLLIYDLIDTIFIKKIPIPNSVSNPIYIPNTNKIILGENIPVGMNEGWTGEVLIYDLDNDSTEYLSFNEEAIKYILVSDDGSKAFIYSSGGNYKVWDLNNKTVIKEGNRLLEVTAFVNKNNFIIIPNWDSESIDVINIENGDTVYSYNDFLVLIDNIIISRDTNYIIASGGILNDTLGMVHGNYLVVYNNLFKDYQSVKSNDKNNFNCIIKPNPTNEKVKFEFELNAGGSTYLKLFNEQGKFIKTLLNKDLEPGIHEYEFNTAPMPQGMYFITLENGKFKLSDKFIIKR